MASVLNEIHPVTWPLVDLQLRDTFANRFDSAEVAERQAPDSDVHADTCGSIFHRGEPLFVFGCLANFDNGESGSHGIRGGGLPFLCWEIFEFSG